MMQSLHSIVCRRWNDAYSVRELRIVLESLTQRAARQRVRNALLALALGGREASILHGEMQRVDGGAALLGVDVVLDAVLVVQSHGLALGQDEHVGGLFVLLYQGVSFLKAPADRSIHPAHMASRNNPINPSQEASSRSIASSIESIHHTSYASSSVA